MKKIYLKTDKENTFIRVENSYNLGGIDFASYGQQSRGYYVHVSPVEIDTSRGYRTESYVAFSGYKALVKPVNRKSKKAEQGVDENLMFLAKSMIDRVCQEQGLKIVEGA